MSAVVQRYRRCVENVTLDIEIVVRRFVDFVFVADDHRNDASLAFRGLCAVVLAEFLQTLVVMVVAPVPKRLESAAVVVAAVRFRGFAFVAE